MERKLTIFALFYFVFEGNFQVQAPGGLYSEGRFKGGFFALRFWGAYFRNFMVFPIVVQQPPLIIDGLDWFVTRSCDTCMK